jgi:hypothetical protein
MTQVSCHPSHNFLFPRQHFLFMIQALVRRIILRAYWYEFQDYALLDITIHIQPVIYTTLKVLHPCSFPVRLIGKLFIYYLFNVFYIYT